MFLRLFAIALFVLAVGPAEPAYADSFTKRFIPDKPPQAAPMLNFEDVQGHALTLKDFKGRYLLVNLWASWCQPCVHEMPMLDALQSKFSYRQFEILALAEDHEALAAAQAFYSRHGLKNLQVFVDASGQAPSLLGARGLPLTFFIDPSGMEIGRVEGEADWNAPDAVGFVSNWVSKQIY